MESKEERSGGDAMDARQGWMKARQSIACDGVPAAAYASVKMQLSPGDEAAPGTVGSGEDVCPVCKGSGRLSDGKDCPNCEGTGKIIEGIGGG